LKAPKAQLGFKRAYNGSEFAKFPIDFKKFTTIINDELPNDAGKDEDLANRSSKHLRPGQPCQKLIRH
jgi:Xaa-Pro aminopeptidase